ncbi:MAG: dTDP-4-dehydrorhamnose 3,5-epimerase [Bryobacteraceae bacterium]|jgi:dTDP-4-dehydrorhamnose 3,5-epimerase
MPLKFETTEISGVHVITPEIFQDQRGFFLESFRQDSFRQHGLPTEFVQDNHSGSLKGVLRGLHFQWGPPMAKLMRVTRGTAFLMAVDIRKGSPTLGKWFGVEASADNRVQVFAPAGCARGFCVLSEYAEVQYKCTGLYNSRCESGIRWNDPEVGITWPVRDPIISPKDAVAQTLAEWLARPESEAFTYADH